MIDQTINLATQTFLYLFFNCQALFAFDNTANDACFAENNFSTKKMNIDAGEKQLQMRNDFNNIMK